MSFLFPSFLFSLFAFSIPVIIHLFNFRRYKKIFFTNVNFIASVQEETKSQNNLRHLLLLLLRLLALAAIIFAFAQPFIPQKQSTVNPGKNYIALYIDNSFSMSNTAKEGELLQFAKKKTEEIAKSYSEGDGYQLVTNDFDIKHRHWVTQKEVIKLISEVSVSPASKKLSEVYAHMREAYRDVNAHNKLAYIVSDYQTSFADISATAKDRDTSIN
ncbi:MAG: BatA domain-containing protein, partial [Bacteroidetes bacterium]|nr:BatA domain-containing protein [Bacteroidota bacterium]